MTRVVDPPLAPAPGRWRSVVSTRRVTVLSAAYLLAVVLAALGSLPWALAWYDDQNRDNAIRHPPTWTPVVGVDAPPGQENDLNPPSAMSFRGLAHQVSGWLGYDDLGRSLLFRLLPGLLVSLTIGLSAAAMAVTVGTLWGATAALFGGRVDLLMMRVVDLLYGLPYLLMVVLLKVSLQPILRDALPDHPRVADVAILFLAIGGVSWLTMARVVRGQVLSLRAQPFVDAARVAGATRLHLLRRHILPNIAGPVIVYASLIVPQAILQEAFLSFLGVGVQQPTPSLGRLAADGVEAVNSFVSFWWLLFFPCAALVTILLALNFVGDALREAYDPKSTAASLV